ncbi:hypothetical protein T265_02963 [Opisthorchis viverrini]|uniref:N-acetylglucosaminylphosphatidylinositol deacetylase n=1 Tax=Opisthorchis viverrini TaxID=6198 RepID=A0A074ZT68_OPIVI|nr:hypothetical protein T265_02963 [Opisthorchis viverrini]KER30608.1 hypothetical protein T265_02963 [Opisthorchis viverrini]
MMADSPYALNNSLRLQSAPDVTKFDAELPPSNQKVPRKRSKLALDALNLPGLETYSIRLPTTRLSDVAATTPKSLRRQLKCFLRTHLCNTFHLPIWPSILINGPPFCGKTLLLEAVCGTLGAKLMTVSIGTVPANMRAWIDIFTQAKNNAPCVLHLDDIEGMEKHTTPAGTFRITCLLKSQLLRDLIGSGVAVVGETRSLLASLPQSVVDLFTQRLTFGMLSEEYRLGIFKQYLLDDVGDEFVISTSPQSDRMQLSEGLTCLELARRTPGYEAGDIIRLIGQLHMSGTLKLAEGELQAVDSDMEESDKVEPSARRPSFAFDPDALMSDESMDSKGVSSSSIVITRALVDEALSLVVPAVKNTAEFVTIPDVNWTDVGGLDSTKTQLYNRFMLLVDDWKRAQALGRRSGGVLLEGPPGCGKTLVAKALSNQAGLNFLSVKGPEVLNKFQGESERRVREIFERARACQPCLIFFDEIDAICPKRDSDESTGSRVSLVNQLLVELDGVDKHRSARVFVVGATNRKDMIDPAVLRPGRLGLHLVINPPQTPNERLAVLSACTRGATVPRIEGGITSLDELAKDPRTENMSGADLDNVLELAKQNAQLDRQDFISRTHLFAALAELFLFTCLLIHVWTWWLKSRRATRNHIKGPVLLVTAHPDDETMFFSPILLWLKKVNVPVDLLCFSAGNYEGLGAIRANELRQAAKCFGIRNLRLIDSPTIFPDSPSVDWCPKSILEEVGRTCEQWGSRTLITFDEYGVSSHPNHRAISLALRTLTQGQLPPCLWLQSVHVFRKYCWIIDTLYTSLVQPENCLIFYVPLSSLVTAYTTMFVHRSQLVWYRWLYILFSVYMYKNTLVKA